MILVKENGDPVSGHLTSGEEGTALRPSFTFDAVYGTGALFYSRIPWADNRWLPVSAAGAEQMSAGMVALSGRTPLLCHAGAVTPQALALFAAAGVEITAQPLTYSSEEEQRAVVTESVRAGLRVVLQHAQPPDPLLEPALWIPSALLSWLNNKKNLAELVPAEHVAVRSLVPFAEVVAHPGRWLPCAVKAATDQSTGGGYDVVACRTIADLDTARSRFQPEELVVVEEWLDVRRSLCLHFASIGGVPRYFGSAEQIIDSNGLHAGNWGGAIEPPSAASVECGLAIMTRAMERGYQGVAGFDIMETTDDRSIAVDLNFRMNASTGMVLFDPAIQERWGPRVLLLQSFLAPDFEAAARILEPHFATGRLVPLVVHDAAQFLVRGVTTGRTREEAAAVGDAIRSALREAVGC